MLPKAPLAVAGILATPLFFVALMAFSLVFDKPSVEVTKKERRSRRPGAVHVATIYLLSFGVSALVVLIGVLALLLPVKAAVFVPSHRRDRSHDRAPSSARHGGGRAHGALSRRGRPHSDEGSVGSHPPRRVGGECAPNGQPDRSLDDRYSGCGDRGRCGARCSSPARCLAAGSPAPAGNGASRVAPVTTRESRVACTRGEPVHRARGGGARRQADEPGQGALPEGAQDEARPRRVLPRGRRGDRARARTSGRRSSAAFRTG